MKTDETQGQKEPGGSCLLPARSTEDGRRLEGAWGDRDKLGTQGAWRRIWDFHAWVTQTYINPSRKPLLTANHKLLAFHLRLRCFFSFCLILAPNSTMHQGFCSRTPLNHGAKIRKSPETHFALQCLLRDFYQQHPVEVNNPASN